MTLLVVVVTAVATVALLLVAIDQNRDIERQADDNELHIDCIIAYLTGLDPPDCRAVTAELIEAGYLPPEMP